MRTETVTIVFTDLVGSTEDASLPYRPFVEALRHFVAHAPEEVLRAHVEEHRGELGRLIPELGRRIADLPAPQVAEAETERYMLFDAVTGLLSRRPRSTLPWSSSSTICTGREHRSCCCSSTWSAQRCHCGSWCSAPTATRI